MLPRSSTVIVCRFTPLRPPVCTRTTSDASGTGRQGGAGARAHEGGRHRRDGRGRASQAPLQECPQRVSNPRFGKMTLSSRRARNMGSKCPTCYEGSLTRCELAATQGTRGADRPRLLPGLGGFRKRAPAKGSRRDHIIASDPGRSLVPGASDLLTLAGRDLLGRGRHVPHSCVLIGSGDACFARLPSLAVTGP